MSSSGCKSISARIYRHKRTKTLKSECVGDARFRFACLDGLPDTPAADVLNLLTGGILDFPPFEYRNANSFTQIFDVEYFAEKNRASVSTDVGGSERADDRHTLSQQGKVNEVCLDS
jgi:hypothetical protein